MYFHPIYKSIKNLNKLKKLLEKDIYKQYSLLDRCLIKSMVLEETQDY